MDKSIYIEPLIELCEFMETVPNTLMGVKFKIICLVTLNMQYEKIAFNKNIETHPYILVAELINRQIENIKAFKDILFIEDDADDKINYKELVLEEKHHDLWNSIWNKYSDTEYEVFIERCKTRFTVNGIEDLIAGKKVLDVGCGNGATCFALLNLGASSVYGIDFGEDSIIHANQKKAKIPGAGKADFRIGNAYQLPFGDAEFDFVVSKGVFHHLNDEEKALKEVFRVLKPGGHFYYYVDGEGGISYDLWDYSVKMLRDVPEKMVYNFLTELNVKINKKIHLTDALKATYKHTSWAKLTAQLSGTGFDRFRRLLGGCDFDFDPSIIEKDPFGCAKFGEGDLRVLAQKP
jgi:ubiquinone/menaquinone biosynthesis C-methylase UbiE